MGIGTDFVILNLFQMTRTAPEWYPLQASTPHQRKDIWPLCGVQLVPYMADLLKNQVSSLEPSSPETETLPLGHCFCLEWLKEKNWKLNNSEIKRKH
ncbi:hypothetical protein AVEN_223315-1 [Araneus ventricosus]|uniref:Uncharacterized protein n=1 Tax=Araneus ventricosus TaxID=182803 RepID=A0A4Y2PBN1_ARAVE|nr:hypothetical protein AVEN_223315-1 [Araneus ventricosus]